MVIIFSVVGSVVLLTVVAIGLVVYMRKRTRNNREPTHSSLVPMQTYRSQFSSESEMQQFNQQRYLTSGSFHVPTRNSVGMKLLCLHLLLINFYFKDSLKDAPSNMNIPFQELTTVKRLGGGAFGEVFQCSWRGITVAVKKIKDGVINEKEVTNFLNEAQLMA